MKKIAPIITLVSILLNLALIYLFVIKGETVKTTDSRVAISLSSSNKDFVLDEMRGFLESVQAINEGLLNNNPTLVIEAGKKSGGSVIEHAPNGMMKALPMGFKKLGFATHDLFDEFATTSTENFNYKATHQKLNLLLNNCITCHRTYKIEVTNKKK